MIDYGEVAETLLGYVETNTTDQAAGTLEVPASAYTDPDRWRREMDLIFLRLPLLLGLTIELPRPGDYKTIDVLERPVLLWRGRDGIARAFLNVCTHRGAIIARAPCANAARLACPYHGWTFGADGRLLGVADRHKFGDIDTTGRGLTELPCAETAGLIFVTLTPGLETDIAAFLGGMRDELESFRLDTWHYVGQSEIFGANWKVAYDGYLEGYHFAQAHPKTINPRTFSNVMKYDAFGPHMRTGYATSTIGDLRSVPRESWGGRENSSFDFVRTLFPNVSIFLAPEIGQIALLLPGPTPDRNRTLLIYLSREAPRDAEGQAGLDAAVTFLRDVVDQEDYALGMEVQRGLASGALRSVVFGRNERGNQYFHRWVDHYLAGAPPGREPVL